MIGKGGSKTDTPRSCGQDFAPVQASQTTPKPLRQFRKLIGFLNLLDYGQSACNTPRYLSKVRLGPPELKEFSLRAVNLMHVEADV